MILAARTAVDEMRAIYQARFLIRRDFADNRVRDDLQIPGCQRVRQQQVYRTGKFSCGAAALRCRDVLAFACRDKAFDRFRIGRIVFDKDAVGKLRACEVRFRRTRRRAAPLAEAA